MPFIRKVHVLFKTRLIFPRINGPNVIILLDTKVDGIEWLGNLPSITNEDCVLSVKRVFFFLTLSPDHF